MDVQPAGLTEALALVGDPALYDWVRSLRADPELPVPGPATLADALAWLRFTPVDAAEIRSDAERYCHPAGPGWLISRCAGRIAAGIGALPDEASAPPLPDLPAPLGRYFYVYVFAAVLPAVREFHQGRGIDDADSARILGSLGDRVAEYRSEHGSGGYAGQGWTALAFQAGLFRLGRLSFNRGTIGDLARTVAASGRACAPTDYALGVHVPAGGRLDPSECDAAFQRAANFFARHFPEERYALARCGSWLLDDQLAEFLPADSNIVQFQRRFRLSERTSEFSGILEAVFGRDAESAGPDLDRLVPRNALQYGVLRHLRGGGVFHNRFGWLALPPPAGC